jgi:hypothetical protein
MQSKKQIMEHSKQSRSVAVFKLFIVSLLLLLVYLKTVSIAQIMQRLLAGWVSEQCRVIAVCSWLVLRDTTNMSR